MTTGYVEELLGRWDRWYRGSPPVAHLLRAGFADRWVRIHSLPGGKRYPSEEGEYEELRRRHRIASAFVFDAGSSCIAIVAAVERPSSVGREVQFCLVDGWAERYRQRDIDYFERRELYLQSCSWSQVDFDKLITEVADDRWDPIMFVNHESGAVYAPYDGGADLFLESSAQRAFVRTRLRDFLSSRPDGL